MRWSISTRRLVEAGVRSVVTWGPTFTCLEARQRQAVCLRVEPDEMVATESTLTFCEWGFSLVARHQSATEFG